MKNKLPCELIRDLFPSYIDHLTSEVTDKLIGEHLEECEECRHVLETMKDPAAEPVDVKNSQEIDFLKKTRKKTKTTVLGSILAAAIVIAVVLFARFYLIGTHIYSEYISCNVNVNGNELRISGAISDEGLGISDVAFEEENGVVTVSFKSVHRSFLNTGDFEEIYQAEEEITEVRLDDRILWSDGKKISAVTSAVYNSRHPYIGDMPANGRTAGALNIGNYLGNFTNQLQTAEEPYEWKLILANSFSSGRRAGMEEVMKSYAYAMLAVIDNMGQVSYEYVIDGETCELTVTSAEATVFAGQDIKVVGENVSVLQSLMEKTGLTDMSYVSTYSQHNPQDTLQIVVVNYAEDTLCSMNLSCYQDGELCSTQGTEAADDACFVQGENVCFTFIPDDFESKAWLGQEELLLEMTVTDQAGNVHEVSNPVEVAAEFGCVYKYELVGNAAEGYRIEQ